MITSKKRKYWRDWHFKNHKNRMASAKKYRQAHPDRVKKASRNWCKKNLIEWFKFIPKQGKCECCGREIFLQSKNKDNVMVFDHRHGKSLQIKQPIPWLMGHACNEKNKILWEAHDFGTLCLRCNFKLPTEGRSEFLKNAFYYHFGKIGGDAIVQVMGALQ